MNRSVIIACVAILLVAVLGATPAAADNSLALPVSPASLLSVAAANICAYTAPYTRDCAIANSGRWKMAVFPEGVWGDFDNRADRMIRLNATITAPAVLTALYFHEIQHAKDFEDGLVNGHDPDSCAYTERHAYAAQIAIWHWMAKTFGAAPNTDNVSASMNGAIAHDGDGFWVSQQVQLAERYQCSRWG